ncbi:hypothetical protein [Merismopedia glauca]|uniref:Transposase n=1 Tax=Merismopedia glauca CCAP 1448/3 TaxID=1296344 RepID=A0A2T1C544_9CYAN|nr:hypothetical protein [Merismopedia glauca]PSB03371.1 hypothetical protein C7B64_08965 [Merismopedia glauca CCAP 1448/3]
MSPKKLSEADKNEILRMYRHSPETTSTLATHYGVSSSTISRFLKSNLPEAEYEALIQQKRAQSIANPSESVVASLVADKVSKNSKIKLNQPINSEITPIQLESVESKQPRQLEIEPILSAAEPPIAQLELESETERDAGLQTQEFLPLHPTIADETASLPEIPPKKILPNLPGPSKPVLLTPTLDIELESEDGLDDDFDEDWEDDELEPEEETELLNLVPRRSDIPKIGEKVKILPLSAATLPKVCYLVVDRSAELIARPLRDFSDLGSIPDSEVQEKTLPVFPNHRVAMRFSNRSQRVIKVPDSGILEKTSPQLQAKGITRLLVNGQVYSLGGFDLEN